MSRSAMTTEEWIELKQTLLFFVKRVGDAGAAETSPEEVAILPDIVTILINSF